MPPARCILDCRVGIVHPRNPAKGCAPLDQKKHSPRARPARGFRRFANCYSAILGTYCPLPPADRALPPKRKIRRPAGRRFDPPGLPRARVTLWPPIPVFTTHYHVLRCFGPGVWPPTPGRVRIFSNFLNPTHFRAGSPHRIRWEAKAPAEGNPRIPGGLAF